MSSNQTIREPFDSTQYKFYLIPDYSANESVIMMKIHHCMFDGLGGAAFCLALSDESNINIMPAMKPLSFCK
jgi:hypothetical protein